MEALDLIPGFEASAIDADSNEPITDPELVATALSASFGLSVQAHELEHQQDDSWHLPLTREVPTELVANGFWGTEVIVPKRADLSGHERDGADDAVRISIEIEWPEEAP